MCVNFIEFCMTFAWHLCTHVHEYTHKIVHCISEMSKLPVFGSVAIVYECGRVYILFILYLLQMNLLNLLIILVWFHLVWLHMCEYINVIASNFKKLVDFQTNAKNTIFILLLLLR